MSPIPAEATIQEVRSALESAGLPIERVDVEEPGATAKRAAWVRLVAPELPWKCDGTPYHLQRAVEAASAVLLGREGKEAEGKDGEEDKEEEKEEEEAAADGEEGDNSGGSTQKKRKAGEGEEGKRWKLEGPKEGDSAGEVYATPSSPRKPIKKGAPMEEVVDGDAWRIAKAYAAQLHEADIEIAGEKVVVEAPLVQVRGGARCGALYCLVLQRCVNLVHVDLAWVQGLTF